jgi:branched-chain amino acid transport system substrate-binding protein
MHRAFTSTFIVLALGVVIGAYIVLEPLSLENIAPIPTERGAAVVPVELASPTTPASPASIDKEVAKRLAFETAKAERLFLAGKAPALGNPEASSSASLDARAASETALPASPPLQDAVPAMAATAVSNDTSANTKAVNEAARPATLVDRAGVMAGTQLAPLTPDEICQRDRDRLARLRASPSGEEAQRFTSELGCLKLLPQVLDLMGRSARTPYAAEVPNTRSSGTSASSEAVPPAPAAEPSPPRETAEGEQANLDVQLEGKPFGTATRRPVEITDPPKRPDTRKKLTLAGKAAPPAAAEVPNAAPSGAQAAREDVRPALPVGRANVGAPTSDETCKRDEGRLVRLRLSSSGEETQRFASELGCEALRPQLQRLMESLGLAASVVSAPNDLSRSSERQVLDTQTRTRVAAAESIAAPPSGRVALLSAGSIDSIPATALANPGVSVPGAVGDVSPRGSDGVEPTIQGISDKEILFGMAAPFSGAARELGRQMKIGVETAFSQINSAGGVNGRLLRLVAADDGYEPEKTADAMHLLYDKEKVFGFIGNVGTPTAAVALPFALDHRTLFFGAFTGASLLRRDPPDRYVFNYRASYAEETKALVLYLVKVKHIQPKEIVVFAQQDSYGDSGYAGVQKAVHSLPGNNPDVVRLNYKRNTIDVPDAVEGLRAYKGQIKAVVMIASYRAAAKFIEKTRDLYPSMIYANVSFVGSTALADELMLLGPRYATGVIVTQVVPAINSYATIVLKYKEALAKYSPGNSPDYVSFEGYIDASILAEAVQRVGRGIDSEKLVEELERMHDFDLGLGAPVAFSPNDHQGSHRVSGTQLDETGHFRPIDLE